MPDYYAQTNPCCNPYAKMDDPPVMPFGHFGMMPFGFDGRHFFHHHFHHHFFHHHFPFGFGGFGRSPFGF